MQIFQLQLPRMHVDTVLKKLSTHEAIGICQQVLPQGTKNLYSFLAAHALGKSITLAASPLFNGNEFYMDFGKWRTVGGTLMIREMAIGSRGG
ncbi:MAG: hypothetical protein ACLU4N_17595 [Butyricimonas faecihominis]